MAVFELKYEEVWLPQAALGHGCKACKVRCHGCNGECHEFDVSTERRITVTDLRMIRHLKADPRFALISE